MSTTWDLIIVGAGSAGIPAAIFAGQRGARVLLVEADNRIGGTLYWSSGQISAAGSRVQKELGIEDSPQEHYDDAQRIVHGGIDPVLGRLAIDNAAGTLDWLMDSGLELDPATPTAGMAHEPYRTRRYCWGMDKAISILDVMRPILMAEVERGSVDLRLETRFTGFVRDGGAVTGITVRTKDGAEENHLGANVLLTTGGYAASPEVWAKLTPNAPLRSHCNPFSRGEGIVAAEAIGAKVDGGERFLCTFAGVMDDPGDPLSAMLCLTLAPQIRVPWEIYVNTSGKRFVREDHPSVDHREHALLAQDEMRMYIVFDEGIRQNAPPVDMLHGRKGMTERLGNHSSYLKADSIADLAKQAGLDAATLEATITRYNASVDSGTDDEFGRETMMRRIEKPPFYAISAVGFTVLSPGGIVANGALQVIGTDGAPIPNLYAAGEVLGFARLSGEGFVGGMSLMPAMTFGRILGQSLLKWEGARDAAE